MRFSVPFEFRSNVRLQGKRAFRPQTLSASVVVDIPELSTEEVPLVVTLPGKVRMGYKAVPPTDIRNWKGHFFQPFWKNNEAQDALSHFTVEQFLDYAMKMPPNSSAIPADDPNITGEENSERARVEHELIERYNSFIAVDGVIFETTPEPLYHQSHSRLPQVTIATDGPEKIKSGSVWRLDRFDAMVTELRRRGLVEDIDLHSIAPARVEVLRPDLLAFDDERFAIARDAGLFIDGFQTSNDISYGFLAEASPAALFSWATIRDALKTVHDLETDIEAFASELAHLCELTEAEGLNNYRLRDAKDAVQRWTAGQEEDLQDDFVLNR